MKKIDRILSTALTVAALGLAVFFTALMIYGLVSGTLDSRDYLLAVCFSILLSVAAGQERLKEEVNCFRERFKAVADKNSEIKCDVMSINRMVHDAITQHEIKVYYKVRLDFARTDIAGYISNSEALPYLCGLTPDEVMDERYMSAILIRFNNSWNNDLAYWENIASCIGMGIADIQEKEQSRTDES